MSRITAKMTPMLSAERSRCPNCHRWVESTSAECPDCGQSLATRPGTGTRSGSALHTQPGRQVRNSVIILVFVLGAYAGAVYGIGAFVYYRSPEYKVQQEILKAEKIMGRDEGRAATPPQLYEAYEHYLNAVAIDPELISAYRRIEAIEWRYAERQVPVPSELKQRLNMASSRSQILKAQAHPGVLPVGPADRWDFQALSDIPVKAVKFGLFGASVIITAWVYLLLKRSFERAQRRMRR